MWHHNFKQAGYQEIVYSRLGDLASQVKVSPDGITLNNQWENFGKGSLDRLAADGYVK